MQSQSWSAGLYLKVPFIGQSLYREIWKELSRTFLLQPIIGDVGKLWAPHHFMNLCGSELGLVFT